MTEKAPSIDQDGKMINPHNPDFITKVPWYLGTNTGPTLKHHNIQKVDHVLSLSESDELVNRKIAAQRESAVASNRTVYKKGACKNCGAMTHKEKDCVERPRSAKKAAWKSGLDIAPDEVSLDLETFGKVSYSAKRDHYKGYNPEEYQEVVEKHNRLEAERKKISAEAKEQKRKDDEDRKRRHKEEKKLKAAAKAVAAKESGDGSNTTTAAATVEDKEFSDSDSDSDYGSDAEEGDSDGGDAGSDADDVKARDDQARDFQNTMAPQGGLGGAGMRVTVRNLRLREDTPKYLRNLDLGSAFYDPKSRSMRLNPHPDANPEDLQFAGDNFVRHTGDAVKLAQNLVLCWEMQARGESIDVISNPSQAELVQKQFVEKKKVLEENKRQAILEKYLDGKEMPKEMDPRLKLGQTEAYVEYSRDGRIIKGAGAAGSKSMPVTKYEEDVFTNNHTSVWGSYFCRAKNAWGYACCHSVLKNSYCTGEVGKEANKAAGLDTYQARKMLESTKKLSSAAAATSSGTVIKKSDLYGDGSVSSSLDPKKLAEAQRRAEAAESTSSHAAGGVANGSSSSSSGGGGGTKRALYNSMQNAEVTAEDLEVYRMKKLKSSDPMAAFADSEELLEYDSSKR